MPIYEFECGRCGVRFDRLQAMSDRTPVCPSCGADRARRLISIVAGLSGAAGATTSSSGCGCGGACACGR
jgi:putative FmdB family regulatory protein